MIYKILKLKSGEELIAEITDKNRRTMTLTRPMVFRTTTMMDPIGRPYDMTILKDWLIHSQSKEVEIPKNHVASIIDPNPETTKLYNLEVTRLDNIIQETKQITDEDIVNKLKEKKKLLTDEQVINEIFGNLFKEMEEMGQDAYNKIADLPELPPENNVIDQDNSENSDFIERPMIYISMMLPPEAIMDLMNAGILNPKQLSKIAKKIKKDNKFTGDEKDHPNYGNRWTDWSPDPNSDDYDGPKST
jgi:hypothetical protein